MTLFLVLRTWLMNTCLNGVGGCGRVSACRSAAVVAAILGIVAAIAAQSSPPPAPAPGVLPVPDRGVYLWRAAGRMHDARRVCAVTRRIGATALWLAVSRSMLERPDTLAGFLSAATHGRLRVHAVLSENTWALASGHASGLARVDRILAWNRQQGEATRFAGLQLDVEVHALPRFKAAKRLRRDDPERADPVIREMLGQWLDWNAAVAARAANAELPLPVGVAVPHWLLKPSTDYAVTWRGRNRNVVDHLLDLVDEVVVMAYVENPKAAAKLAADEVRLADAADRRGRVRVALNVSPRAEAGTSLFALGWPAVEKALAATDNTYAGRRGYAGTAIHMWAGLARLDARREGE